MLERVLAHLRRPRRGRGRAVARVPPRRLPGRLSRRTRRPGSASTTRWSPSRSTRPAPSPSPARHAGIDDTFIVVNGDVLTDVDIAALVAFHRAHGAAATLHLTAVDDPSRFGVVPTDDDGRVIEFVEKPPPGEAPTNLINAGTYVLEPEVLARIPAGRRVSVERETFPALAADGGVYGRGERRLLARHRDARRPTCRPTPISSTGPRPGPPAPGRRQVGARGVAARRARDARARSASSTSRRRGPRSAPAPSCVDSVLGAGASWSSGAVVEGSVLLPGARVGAGARVIGSILGRGRVVAEGCVAGGR